MTDNVTARLLKVGSYDARNMAWPILDEKANIVAEVPETVNYAGESGLMKVCGKLNVHERLAGLLDDVLTDNHVCGHTTTDTLNAIECALKELNGEQE